MSLATSGSTQPSSSLCLRAVAAVSDGGTALPDPADEGRSEDVLVSLDMLRHRAGLHYHIKCTFASRGTKVGMTWDNVANKIDQTSTTLLCNFM